MFVSKVVIIRSGKIIGDNVKIGAYAVVTHDVPSDCVVAECLQLLLKINIKRIEAVIRSGKVIGDNINIGANAAITYKSIKM